MRAVVSSSFTSAAPTLLLVTPPQSESFSAVRASLATPRTVVNVFRLSMLTFMNLSWTWGLAMKSSTSSTSSARSLGCSLKSTPATAGSSFTTFKTPFLLSRYRFLVSRARCRSRARLTSACTLCPSISTARTNLHIPACASFGSPNICSPFMSCEMTV